MPTLVSDLITEAFIDLRVITVDETISAAMQANALRKLNELVESLSAEGLTIPNQVMQTFQLAAGTVSYTLGSGGTLPTTGGARPQKVTAWRAFYGNILHSGGRVLSMTEFGQEGRQAVGETSTIPGIVAADTAYPLINIRVFPPPSSAPGQLELAYWTPLTNFATAGDSVTLPPGSNRLLRALLAQELWPSYPSPVTFQAIQVAAEAAKAALVEQNAMAAPQPTPAAPQGQR